ncbi:MAG: tRNA (adenosine(37)-N6)-dimethylallyltransferase MiaA, partial [Gammaproteobacteria bacterium]
MSEPAPMRAICLMGPTASGKTDIAIELSQQFPCNLISVDSAQVYRGMNIGAAKPAPEILALHPHRLIDIRDPTEQYSAGDFCRDAVTAIREITAKERVPLFVGGTMLYFQALQKGLADLPEADPELRARLDKRALAEGWPMLHTELAELDPQTAERLRPTDAQRIQRALEVCIISGEPMSTLLAQTLPPAQVEYLNIALIPSDRSVLHHRIEARFERMLAEGLQTEVEGLLEMPGLDADSPALRAVGYRQLVGAITGGMTMAEAREKAVIATRRLAKRQLTWLRSWPDLHAVDSLA